jgi:hypothetical protein
MMKIKRVKKKLAEKADKVPTPEAIVPTRREFLGLGVFYKLRKVLSFK